MFNQTVKQILKENNNLKLILIRGISGSGKTTYAKKLMQQDPSLSHYEADMVFYNDKGEYKFNPSLIHQAHEWCQAKTREDLSKGKSVIVSNTFTERWEMQAYLKMAEDYGAEVIIKKASGNYKNVHDLTPDKIEIQRKKWQNVEGETDI
jgi:deoxyadenosine/deoxycytidine kinase